MKNGKVRNSYFGGIAMLAKMTTKNQLTLPKSILSRLPPTEYFDVSTDNDCIVLTPVKINQAQVVRQKLERLQISSADLDAALNWARLTPAMKSN